MLTLLNTHKEQIDKNITKIINELLKSFNSDIQVYEDHIKRLNQFCCEGKGIRGSLLSFVTSCTAPKLLPQAQELGAVIEIMHGSVLIHDDIIDHDMLRRNKPTIPAQFQTYATKNNYRKPNEFGNSVALCLGDVGFFSAFLALQKINLDKTMINRLSSMLVSEFVLVGLGEIGDITLTYQQELPTLEMVLSMYRYKTARYTFSMPLLLSAILTNASQSVQQQLVAYGEALGLMYQLKDDELSLYGNETTFGKKIGNDIMEDKQTVFKVLLYERLSLNDRKFADMCFGNPNISQTMLVKIMELSKKYCVDRELSNIMHYYKSRAQVLREGLKLPVKTLVHLENLENFLLHRKS